MELTDPILQRFDILCVLQDVVDPLVDSQLASFVVNSHHRSHPNKENVPFSDDRGDTMDGGPPSLDQDILKKYITYARAYVRPIVHEVDREKVCECE